jgi:ferredoxin-nitrite reductase
MVEGYHVFVGGGFGENRQIGRQLAASVAFDDLPPLLEQLLLAWKSQRANCDESFRSWVGTKSLTELQALTQPQLIAA